MLTKKTVDLVKLVEKRAGDSNSSVEAQQLINQGADIKASTKNGSMIDSVVSEARRHQQTFPDKAKQCQQLIQVLKNHASHLFATSVLSSDGGNLAELNQLIRLHANCYQSEKFGPLGLLGELFKQEKTPIRLDIVKFLVETDEAVKFALMRINDQRQTCLSLLSNNPKCPPDVKQFIQNTINMILNLVPYTHPQSDVNEIAEWIHRGANPEAVDNQGNTVLLNAVLSNNQMLVDKLLAVGCNAEHVNNNKHTALQIAQNATPRNAQLEALLKVQSINSELQRLIETQKSLLTFEEVHAVLEKGAKINTLIPNKCTPLHLLIANEGTPEMIAAFINDFNADISAMDINGYRPIEVCILFDKDPFLILQTYLQLPKVSTETYFNPRLNKSIIQFAIEQKRPEAAKIIQDILNLRLWNTMIHANKREENNRNLIPELNLLIKYDAEVDHQHTDEDYEKWTILHLACKITTNIFVQYLIEQLKVNYTLLNGNGDSPLSIAAEYGDLLVVKYLHGVLNAPLNCSNNDKQTPLHLATKNHHLLVVRYLVQWGADHQAENVSKQTPLDIARANKSNNKNDELTDKRLIHFLEQLICPAIEPTDQAQNLSTKPTSDLDICESIKPFIVEPIKATTIGDEERLGQQKKGFLFGNVNDSLLNAAKDGSLTGAKTAIGEGANICYRKNNRNAYEIATQSAIEYQNQSKASPTNTLDHQQYVNKMKFCQQIAELLRHTAYERMIQAMQESDAYRVVAYHQAGAPLAVDLLNFICKKSDNVQIVDYLIQQSAELFQAMFNYSTTESPYQIAKNHKFNNVASYLKYRLSLECTKAIQANDIEGVKKLIRAGARVEMHDTNNLLVAIYKHRNVDMVRLLCENGAKMPIEWLQSKQISLPTEIAKTIDSNIVFRINRSLLNRRLRLAAACGDLPLLTRCQHYGADINSINCHGSTALLCSIQYGNYFPIVHALVSRGATMLHTNKHELMSLIALAKNKNYKQITDYLSQTLNAQFIVTILNNDIKNAERFEALGVDFNFKDEEERTALHYAVQYHGIELVSWLCDRGTSPTIADVNGNYPMTEAAEKGNYAVVELFATKYPATKQQKNKAGLTALQIAEKQGFKRIAYVLKTGKPAPHSMGDDVSASTGPKHTKEALFYAAKNGHLKIIKEFIDDRYESRDEKRHLCFQLIDISKRFKQHEVSGILQPYFDKQLKAELPSDINLDGGIRLSQYYQKILIGFLTSLGNIIAESPVVLDPSDPNTYNDLFINLSTHQKQRSEEIQRVESERDAKKLNEQDISNLNEKLSNIRNELEQVSQAKEQIEKIMEEISEKIKQKNELTAIQLQDLLKQQEEHKRQLAIYECSTHLCVSKQDATLNRQNVLNFFRKQNNTNMFLFFRTIENILQALFNGILAARSNLLTTEKPTFAFVSKIMDKMPISVLPFLGPIIATGMKSSIGGVLSKLDEKQQKKAYHNILMFGNIEELYVIASDTASLLTLYYKEQILSIDTSRMIIEGMTSIKNRPEEIREMPIVIVAEYITALVLETLKGGKSKGLQATEPLPQQLWLSVAKENYFEHEKVKIVTDTYGSIIGQQKIPLAIYKDSGEKNLVYVQLRYLIGCVSVVTDDGKIYQYDVSKSSSKKDFTDLELFGYVYISPFLDTEEAVRSILDGRKLIEAKRDDNNDILTKLKDIEQYVQTYQNQGNEDRQMAITLETARQVAQILREQKSFVNPKDVQNLLVESQDVIEIKIKGYQEEIEKKATYYQTSIDSTKEQLQNDLAEAKETLKKDNTKNYTNALKDLNEKLKQIEKNLENQITERMNTIENHFKTECTEMRKIVDAAKSESNQALARANEAVQTSNQSVQLCKQAREDVTKMAESTEKRRKEFEDVMARCESNVKQAITQEKKSCVQAISDVRTKVQQDFERTKHSAEQAVTNAKESAQAAKESAKSAQETQKDTRKQLDLQKEETNKIISEVKEITKQNERSADEAKDANKHAKQTVDASTIGLKKIDEMQKKMEAALERLEKLSKKLETN